LSQVIDFRKECKANQEKGEPGAMKAYSVDVREKVLRAVDQGSPREEIAKLLGVSRATIKRSLKQRRETGTIAPKVIAGRPAKKVGRMAAELVAKLQAREEERAKFREQMKQVDVRRLVIADECGSNIALTPLYARASKGQRAHGSVPRNRGKNTTLLASLSLSGVGACLIIEGAVDTLAFEAYVEQILAPSLSAGQIVVLDNPTTCATSWCASHGTSGWEQWPILLW
jgi:transposase